MSCINIFKSAEVKSRKEKVDEILDHWAKQPRLQKISESAGGSSHYFKRLFLEITGKDFTYDTNYPSMSKLNKLKRKIDWMENKLGKAPSLFGEWFKLPGNIMKYNPVTKEYSESLSIAGDRYRGNLERHLSNLDTIVKDLSSELSIAGIAQKNNISKNQAMKELRKRQNVFQKLQIDDPAKAEAYWSKNLSRDALLADKGLNVLQSFHELIRDPNLIYKNYDKNGPSILDRGKGAKYGTNLVNAAHLWHSEMSPALFKLLKSGLKNYIDTINDINTRTQGKDSAIANMKNKLQDIYDSLVPEKNYVPTQILDIFPTLSRFSQDLAQNKFKSGQTTEISQYIDSMYNTVKDNLSMSGHALPKGSTPITYMSKDVVGVLDKYVKNVVRFNFTSRASNVLTKALGKLQTLEGKGFDEHVQFMTRYIGDTHTAALGLNVKDSKLHLFSRALTSWQFLSKLGFNIRSAAKNATQSFQNFIYFGRKAMSEANTWSKGEKMHDILQEEMKRHGVFFVEIEEMSGRNQFLMNTKIVEKNGIKRVEEVESSWVQDNLSSFENSKLLKAGGWLMQQVENKINRASTFKIAFAMHYKALSRDNSLIKKAIETNPGAFKKNKGKTLEEKIEQEIIARSSRFAANAVKHLHYDYSIYAKPKALRTSIGSVLGQFSTYSINFFEYQRKILSEAGGDVVLRRQFNTPEAWRAYRLATFYSTIYGILTPLTNLDLTNLIQNDTADFLEGYYWYFAGEPDDLTKYKNILSDATMVKLEALNKINAEPLKEMKYRVASADQKASMMAREIKAIEQDYEKKLKAFTTRKESAFYGMGPAGRLFGPTGSDIKNLIRFGQWAVHANLSDEDNANLHTIYQEAGTRFASAAPKSGIEEYNPYFELGRLLNPQFSRTFGSTIPKIFQGQTSAWTALGQELSLYKPRYMAFTTKDPGEVKQSILAGIRTIAPSFVDPYFTSKEDKEIDKGKKKHVIGTQKYTDKELAMLQDTLNLFR